jgi:hypothetical protein
MSLVFGVEGQRNVPMTVLTGGWFSVAVAAESNNNSLNTLFSPRRGKIAERYE